MARFERRDRTVENCRREIAANCLADVCVARLIPVAHSFGKIAWSIGHIVIPAVQHSGRSIDLCGSGGDIPDIHRPGVSFASPAIQLA